MTPIWKGRKYKLEKSENFEEFLVALGNHVGFKNFLLLKKNI